MRTRTPSIVDSEEEETFSHDSDYVPQKSSAATKQGSHHANEDRFTIEPEFVELGGSKNFHSTSVLNFLTLLEGAAAAYFGLYDGHGGSFAVDFIRDTLHLNIKDYLEKILEGTETQDEFSAAEDEENDEGELDDIKTALRFGFLKTDKDVIQQCRQVNDYSGSCAVAVLLFDTEFYTASLGDSTVFLVRFLKDTQIVEETVILSTHHKPKLEKERILANGGWISSDGYLFFKGSEISCSRSLGDREFKYMEDLNKHSYLANWRLKGAERAGIKIPPEMKFMISPNPAIDFYEIEPSTDAFLIICSDGLSDHLQVLQISQLVQEALNSGDTLDELCQSLIREAANMGSSDDITTIVIPLKEGLF